MRFRRLFIPFGGMYDSNQQASGQVFGVLVFELFIGSRGGLLASECEAHDGWHVEPGNKFSLVQGKLLLEAPLRKAIPTGLTAEFDHAPCPCGREGTRLMNIDAHAAWAVRQDLAAAASA